MGEATQELQFEVAGERVAIRPTNVVIAGWTARDRTALDHHVEELAAIGVPAPSAMPLYYRVAASNAVQASTIDVVGDDTSGEVEPVLIVSQAGILLTVGSDHTDRALEAHSVALSKQIATKPLAGTAWALDAIADLDALELTAEISDDGESYRRYQEGTLAAIKPLTELVEGSARSLGALPIGTVIYCGTLPAIGGVVAAKHFRCALRDPTTRETISLEYQTRTLPIVA